jgi:hypothetical protein
MNPVPTSTEAPREKRLPLWLEIIVLVIGAFAVVAGLYAIIGSYRLDREIRYDLVAAVFAALWLSWKTCGRIKSSRTSESRGA